MIGIFSKLAIFLSYFNFNYGFLAESISSKRLGAVILILIASIVIAKSKNLKFKILFPPVSFYLLYAFAFSITVTTVDNLDYNFYIFQALLSLLTIALIMFIVLNHKINFSEMDLYYFALFGLVLYILFLTVILSDVSVGEWRDTLGANKYFSINSMYNIYVIVPIIFLFLLLFSEINKASLLILLSISVFVLVIPSSKQVIGAFVISAAVFMYYSNVKKIGFILFAMSLISLLFYDHFNILYNLLSQRFVAGWSLDGGSIIRLQNLYESLRIASDYPFGVGLGNYKYYAESGNFVTESSYLQILSELGLFAFIIFLAILTHWYIKIKYISRYSRKMFIFLSAVFFYVLMIGFFNEVFFTSFLLYPYIFTYLIHNFYKRRGQDA